MNNYRPISILPVMSKISDKYVAEQLTEHLISSPFQLHPMQFGFRANHSTETANCFFVENIKSKLDKGGIVGAISMKYSSTKCLILISQPVLLTG